MDGVIGGTRRLGSWIDAYEEYTAILPSPPLFRRWAAIFYMAAAMERKIWVRTMGSDLYPGLYIVLVGPPGVGKGQAIHLGERLLRLIPDLKVGPSDMTAASLVDALNDATRRLVMLNAGEPYVEFNSLTVISRELGVLVPSWDTALMNNLTDVYDGFTIEQKRRGKDLHIKISSPQINLLAACTPSYLNETLPKGAWDQGFISRTLMIYSGDRQLKDPFVDASSTALSVRLHDDLLHDLKSIAMDYGQMQFTADAVTAVKAWVKSGCQPEPTHTKLQFYNSRRLAHLLKLCMISSISRSSDKVITLDNYAEALNWLLQVEAYMPDIFKAMTSGGDSSAMEETWNYAWSLFAKERKPIAEHRLIHFLRERVPAHNIMRVLEIMIKSRMVEIVPVGNNFVGYKPTTRAVREGPPEAPPEAPPSAAV